MSISIKIGLTPESHAVIARHRGAAGRLLGELKSALQQGLAESEAHLMLNHLSGGDGLQPRTGNLRASAAHRLDQPLSGYFGIAEGPASAYAATQLGDDLVTIEPKNAGHLWIPIADNLTPSGLTCMSPREAMEKTGGDGKRLLRIFKSKLGNLVAFLPDQDDKGSLTRYKRRTKSGRKKGDIKGKLLFVLKDQVQIQGTGGLRKTGEEMTPRIGDLLRNAVIRTMEGLA